MIGFCNPFYLSNFFGTVTSKNCWLRTLHKTAVEDPLYLLAGLISYLLQVDIGSFDCDIMDKVLSLSTVVIRSIVAMFPFLFVFIQHYHVNPGNQLSIENIVFIPWINDR